ncbi:charged multivesicular body protein 3-like [Argopecten irradians]|uniref:charged multivesicular body protein 3-like n=1 Tax=Argopecten irradians TaxID=31199 RepID=UPI0037174CCB
MGLFGKTPEKSPKELVQEWNGKLRKETHNIDRSIRTIQKEETKVTREIKALAKKGDKDAIKILAKEVVRSRKAVNRLYASKAQINSVSMQLKNQAAMVRMTGALQKSGEVMKSMQELVKVADISNTMREMSKEMMKAGIMEEMMEDAFESLDDQDDLEEEADSEVDKVLFELTAGTLGKAPEAVNDSLPVDEDDKKMEAAANYSSEEEEDLKGRLEALRS